MFILTSISTDPYFNLAMEEYLLKETGGEYFLTYINEPSVIVGKHQNAYAEINLDFVRRNRIKVARRLTGGGTVFHDPGNLNFAFIVSGREGHLVDFKKHTRPVIGFLDSLSVNAEFAGKNDLLMNGLKISGNAEHVFRNRVLHHGTLLFNSQLAELSEALKVNPMKYRDKAVRSVRSRVSNIAGSLEKEMTIEQLRNLLTAFIRKETGGEDYHLTDEEMERIKALRDEKFSTWEWNFGYAPKYTFYKTFSRDRKEVSITLEVVKGVIEKASVEGALFGGKCKQDLSRLLAGKQHRYDSLLQELRDPLIDGCFEEITQQELVQELF